MSVAPWSTRLPKTPAAWALLLLVGGSGCEGKIFSSNRPPATKTPSDSSVLAGQPDPRPLCVPGTLQPGPSPLRRLTPFEYDRTVHDLLGDTSGPGTAFALEASALGYDNNADAMVMSTLLASQTLDAAETLSQAADVLALVLCDVGQVGETGCATEFIQKFGRRAFRRPLSPAQVSSLQAVYAAARGQGSDHPTGLRQVLEAMLLSTSFLYRVEPAQTMAGPAVAAVDAYGLASRLSYLLWASMPDATLLVAADSGHLTSAADVEREARRMLGDARARTAVSNFHRQWLMLERIEQSPKDATSFPGFASLVPDLQQETRSFLDHAFWDSQTGMLELFTGKVTSLGAPLAQFYGASPRGGFLTQGLFLATQASATETSPVRRGKFVREQLLCDQLPSPPAAFVLPAASGPTATMRERLAAHTQSSACSGCHQLMDPIGLGFEAYDASGHGRDTEAGRPVDAHGVVLKTTDADGPFEGALELERRLAGSGQVRRCIARQWFRFGYGRAETVADACTLEALEQSLKRSGGNFPELLVALTQTDAFLHRTTEAAP